MIDSAQGNEAELSQSKVPRSDSSQLAHSIPLRTIPRKEFFFLENEFSDIYAPIIGPFAAMVYLQLCRDSYGKSTVEYSVRALANGISTATAARAIETLETVGLIKRLPSSGNRKSVCQLFDVKALAESHGAMRRRNSPHFELPKPIFERLQSQVTVMQHRQQGKARLRAVSSGKTDQGVASKSGFHSLLSVSQGDASVSHLLRQRVSRETQIGAHLIEKEERNQKIPPPTPAHVADAQRDKDSPHEDEPDGLLKWARASFIGAIEEWEDWLFNTNQLPTLHLPNGAAEAEKFGFKSLAVAAARRRGAVMVLTLSAGDPTASRDRMLRNAKAAMAGLERYRKSFASRLCKWFDGEVEWEFAGLVDGSPASEQPEAGG